MECRIDLHSSLFFNLANLSDHSHRLDCSLNDDLMFLRIALRTAHQTVLRDHPRSALHCPQCVPAFVREPVGLLVHNLPCFLTHSHSTGAANMAEHTPRAASCGRPSLTDLEAANFVQTVFSVLLWCGTGVTTHESGFIMRDAVAKQ